MSKISLNNGNTLMDADEATVIIEERNMWEAVFNMMDDELREQIAYEGNAINERMFLTEYLNRAEEDLIIG